MEKWRDGQRFTMKHYSTDYKNDKRILWKYLCQYICKLQKTDIFLEKYLSNSNLRTNWKPEELNHQNKNDTSGPGGIIDKFYKT